MSDPKQNNLYIYAVSDRESPVTDLCCCDRPDISMFCPSIECTDKPFFLVLSSPVRCWTLLSSRFLDYRITNVSKNLTSVRVFGAVDNCRAVSKSGSIVCELYQNINLWCFAPHQKMINIEDNQNLRHNFTDLSPNLTAIIDDQDFWKFPFSNTAPPFNSFQKFVNFCW